MSNELNRSSRRRTYIARLDFQRDFIIRFCILTVFAAVVVSGIVYFFCGSTVTTVFKASRLKIVSTNDFVLPYLCLSSLIAIVCSGLACWWMTLVISNRLAGPLYRVETDIAKMAQGDLTMHFRVREKDEFQSLARILNDMARDLRGDIGNLKSNVLDIDRSASLSSEGKESLEKVKEILDKYKV